MDFNAAMQRFRRNFNKDGKGKRIAFMLTGGAYSTMDFRLGCGSSRFLEGCWDPYSNEQLINFAKLSGEKINENDFHSVEAHTAYLYSLALMYKMAETIPFGEAFPIIVASTAALSTYRYRRSANRAYVSLIRQVNESSLIAEFDCWEIALDKISEEDHAVIAAFPDLMDMRRLEEDRKVSQVILALIMKDGTMLPDLRKGESVSLCRSTSGGVENWLYTDKKLKPCSKVDRLCWAEGPA